MLFNLLRNDTGFYRSFGRMFLNPCSKRQILDSFPNKKSSADNNFEFDENSGKFSKWVENTVEKGEIARHEQFLPFSQSFLKICATDT